MNYSIEEYAMWLTDDPPARERVLLMLEWAETQGASGFFLLIEQALSEAAHAVWGTLRGEAAPFDALSGDALFSRLDAGTDIDE